MGDPRADVTPSTTNAAFWWRITDNFFRHMPWLLLPILALAGLGISQAQNTPELYRSSATLSASTNPLVPDQQISELAGPFWETPAGATSRIINERVRTDNFLQAVLERADLTEVVDSGLVGLDVVRTNLWASADGRNILTVNAQWDDPVTSQSLVEATINAYQSFLEAAVASDSSAAESFYTDQLADLATVRDEAQQALESYVENLPSLEDGQQQPLVAQLEIERLEAAIRSAEARLDETRTNIDSAQLARVQLTTEAGKSFTVIDQPRLPSAPESTMIDRLITVATYTMFGVVIAGMALVTTTVLDRSVASVADLEQLDGVALVSTVPTVRVRGQSPRRPWPVRLVPRGRREPAST